MAAQQRLRLRLRDWGPSALAATLALGAAGADAEQRDPCSSSLPERQAFFGDLHVHTDLSFDSYLFESRNGPDEAYQFAKGDPIFLPPLDGAGMGTREVALRRALDFAAVTDHAELFGELSLCVGGAVTNEQECIDLLTAPPGSGLGSEVFLTWGSLLSELPPMRFDWCGQDDAVCLQEAISVWGRVQTAAEDHYDRTSLCSFTTFNAYEWTGSPAGKGMHRNVIFRGDVVPSLPLSYVEAPTPEQLWPLLAAQCASQGPDCEVLAIPHNSNRSEGTMFDPNGSNGLPPTASDNLLRVALEPLVEMYQHKGDSECRLGVGDTTDLNCFFEKTATVPAASDSTFNYVRSALLEGLRQQWTTGVNPFRLGFVGATDTHNATPGATDEDSFQGHAGSTDDDALSLLSAGLVRLSPGGLTVLWAEQNSRDSLYDALERRESYATSGTRPTVRFFGGYDYATDAADPGYLCDQPDAATQAYLTGVPMGGELAKNPPANPRFAVWAWMDPGDGVVPPTPLQRIQIVKGWLDPSGLPQEQVLDVAGSSDNGSTLDLATCQVSGAASASLCTVWEDVAFDPARPAFYYARVLENPSCRWNTFLCNAQGVDCAVGAPPGFESCCDGSAPGVIQERAWTSPISYSPPTPHVPALPSGGVWALAPLGILAAYALLRLDRTRRIRRWRC